MRQDNEEATSLIDHRPNIGRFILFRIFFNCRFYYPVYTILFLDFGLSVGQFAILNAAWAASIVLLEVPSGAFADLIGRRALIIFAAILMIVELGILCLTPVGAGPFVFWLFLINRILSGAAEASCSGADEALAYDSLPEPGREEAWTKVLGRLFRLQPLGFIIASLTGAFLYDAEQLNATLAKVGISSNFAPEFTLKIPIFLTLLMGIGALVVALRMTEPPVGQREKSPPTGQWMVMIRKAFADTMAAGRWVIRTPFPLILLLVGVTFDSIIRLYYTVASNYYRLLDIPVPYFGIIGTIGLLAGIAATWPMERMAQRFSPRINFSVVAVLTLAGLISLAYPIRHWGVLLTIPMILGMRFLHFLISQYLNAATDSANRATVLSFRGIALNCSYGIISVLYGWQNGFLSKRSGTEAMPDKGDSDLSVFAESLTWWPWYYSATVVLLIGASLWIWRRSDHAIKS